MPDTGYAAGQKRANVRPLVGTPAGVLGKRTGEVASAADPSSEAHLAFFREERSCGEAYGDSGVAAGRPCTWQVSPGRSTTKRSESPRSRQSSRNHVKGSSSGSYPTGNEP
jgi:hypothetical protein